MDNLWNHFSAIDIGFFIKRIPASVSQRAKRQQWPYTIESRPGGIINIYVIETLPDEIQIAWAEWNEKKYNNAVKKEQNKGDKGRPRNVPLPVTIEQAKEVLKWTDRSTYFKTITPKDYTKGPKQKVYDGNSVGLCREARDILEMRFGKTNLIKAGKIKHSLNGDKMVHSLGKLTSYKLSFVTGKTIEEIEEQAINEEWDITHETDMYDEKKYQQYEILELPDDYQVAIVQWNKNNYNKALLDENEKQGGRPNHVPKPLSDKLIKTALNTPQRAFFYEGKTNKRMKNNWGLCDEARSILKKTINPPKKNVISIEGWSNKPPINDPPLEPSKICPKCDFGFYINEKNKDAKYCIKCVGTELIETCPHCGREIMTPFSVGCMYCGKLIRSE